MTRDNGNKELIRIYHKKAIRQLGRLRQRSRLAVALAASALLLWDTMLAPKTFAQQRGESSVEEAAGTIANLFDAFYAVLPKLVISALVFLFGWMISRILKWAFHRFSPKTQKRRSILAMIQLGLSFITVATAISVLVGDIRALVGSLGLLGLALSWALQTPIESFSGWVLNMFRGYYRVGDRIEVGAVLGDVYRIDILTTTVWEIGRPGKAVEGAQPTGAVITFPNSEILRSSIINYTRDFDYVWDEVTVGLANETDIQYAINVYRTLAEEVLNEEMIPAIRQYLKLLERADLESGVEERPQLYLSLTDSYINCTIRYLVPIHAKRQIKSILIQTILIENAKPEHGEKIFGAYPRQEVILSEDKSKHGLATGIKVAQ